MKYFKPRFSLFVLMFSMTVAAFLLWAVPAYREFRIKSEFESAARQLEAGVVPSLFQIFPASWLQGQYYTKHFVDSKSNEVEAITLIYDRYWYCIYAHSENLNEKELFAERERAEEQYRSDLADGDTHVTYIQPATVRWTKVFVYRLEPMPESYAAQTESGKKQKLLRDQYLTDFYEVLSGREPSKLGIKYELIHSDTPEVRKK